jgi:hypothetical protein
MVGSVDEQVLTAAERERLSAIRDAESLSDLVAITDAASEHEAYFAAKEEWEQLRGKQLTARDPPEGLPGSTVVVDGHTFHIHGITHSNTGAEGRYLREHVRSFLERGDTVYCEQGIRSMYFDGMDGVCEMDDYLWAMDRCAELEGESHVEGVSAEEFDGLAEEVRTLASSFSEAAFSLIDSASEVYGDRFSMALGDVASEFLLAHEHEATGEDYEAFVRNRRAAEDPDRLVDLQHYYLRTFLPQPLEREWLARHDRELEVVTHARNERMAEYAVYHNESAPVVHLIVGAAHQPGVAYYLHQYSEGRPLPTTFETAR